VGEDWEYMRNLGLSQFCYESKTALKIRLLKAEIDRQMESRRVR
jgi:hypothetical protein